MDVYLAAASLQPFVFHGRNDLGKLLLLESFFYASKRMQEIIPYAEKLLLDSGAFTFVNSRKNETVDWNEYVDRYAEFIKSNNISLFFELDIDKLIGYGNVLKLRKRLELKTGRQCIPVWHKSRGKQAFSDMCKEYSYISIGGLVGAGGAGAGAYSSALQKYFPWFIDIAHENGAKIHALGFTSLEGLRKYHFDSVDSTSWKSGNRFGGVYQFNGESINHIQKKKNQRMTNTRELLCHNFNEWVKFQRYAKEYL